jgi:hypothetical protein
VLPASVEQARFTTVLSSSGKMLTEAVINLKVGDLRFLKLQMPSDACALWAAMVNGAVVRASRDGETLNIPLDNLTVDRTTAVTLIYADRLPGNSLRGRRALRLPRFPDVPLREIAWRFFVPPEFRYEFVEGDFDRPTTAAGLRKFEKADYENWNRSVNEKNTYVARNNLRIVGGLLDSGRQKEAQQALQVAVNSSVGDQTLNEDARIQFRNVAQQQVKMGLVNRRAELRQDNNIFEEQSAIPNEGFNGGNFNPQYAANVDEQLSAQDRAALDRVARRIVGQQEAAAGQAAAINIAMPEHGRGLSCYRSLQGEKGGELQLVMAFDRPSSFARVLVFWPALLAFAALWGLFKLAAGRRRASDGVSE